jgi:hypothetical protein
MSLAMFAAPFHDDIDSSSPSDNNLINKKRQAHTKTQKKYPKEAFDSEKVNSVLQKIHSNNDDDEEDDNNTYSFTPPPKPESSGVNKTKQLPQREPMTNYTPSNEVTFKTLGKAPSPNYDGGDNLDLNNYNNIYGNENSNNEYYKNVIPNYNTTKNPSIQNSSTNKPYYNNYNNNYIPINNNNNQDILLQKLNYMITLLEDQQDERTNNVTEEVVLYSFLGIFIIFIADSFVKTGKYVR